MFMITDCALGRNDDDQHEQSNHVETIGAKAMHMQQLSRAPASATATDETSKHTNKQTNKQRSNHNARGTAHLVAMVLMII